MRADKHLLGLCSSICKDLSVAFFIAAIVSQQFLNSQPFFEALFALTKNLISGTLFMYLSWKATKKIQQL